jgi:anti-sigma28 factor (negative regulator of flagellin synthesis)
LRELRKTVRGENRLERRKQGVRHRALACTNRAPLADSAELTQFDRQDSIPTAYTPALRMERIAILRKAIAEGRYYVPAGDLAQKLIDHMLANRPSEASPEFPE